MLKHFSCDVLNILLRSDDPGYLLDTLVHFFGEHRFADLHLQHLVVLVLQPLLLALLGDLELHPWHRGTLVHVMDLLRLLVIVVVALH